MKVSTKGRYGLRIMIELAIKFGEGPILADTIAENQGISVKYIHNIVSSMKTTGLVRVARGRNGGYELTRPPSQVNALEVISALEGAISVVDCVSVNDRCTRAGSCVARDLWIDVSEAISKVLKGVTLDELAQRQKSRSNEPLSYSI